LEFVGPFEERGWKLAGAIVPVAYMAWSLWLIVAGLVLLVASRRNQPRAPAGRWEVKSSQFP
jgi:hypothetical protein